MSTEENKAVVRRFLEECWNAGKLDVVDEIVAAEYVNRTEPDQPPGPEAVKHLISTFRGAFPDVDNVIEDLVAEGDKVAVRVTIHGTHKGELFGIPPTEKRVKITGMAIYRLADGKLVEHWVTRDHLGLLQQLEIIPTFEPQPA
jgi:steroid delta-isomerase-like uncharacterized protein